METRLNQPGQKKRVTLQLDILACNITLLLLDLKGLKSYITKKIAALRIFSPENDSTFGQSFDPFPFKRVISVQNGNFQNTCEKA